MFYNEVLTTPYEGAQVDGTTYYPVSTYPYSAYTYNTAYPSSSNQGDNGPSSATLPNENTTSSQTITANPSLYVHTTPIFYNQVNFNPNTPAQPFILTYPSSLNQVYPVPYNTYYPTSYAANSSLINQVQPSPFSTSNNPAPYDSYNPIYSSPYSFTYPSYNQVNYSPYNPLYPSHFNPINPFNVAYEINNNDDRILQLQDYLNGLEQNNRKNCLEIRGLPKSENEDEVLLKEIMIKIASENNVTITENDIEVIYRIPTRNKSRIEPILVQLSSRNKKEKILAHRKKIKEHDLVGNNSTNVIKLYESLTTFNKELLCKAKQKGRELNFKHVWSCKGKILMKKEDRSKTIHIKNTNDLNHLY